jgi:hypothetical protein
MENEEKAGLISLESLTGKEIGEVKNEKKEAAEKELASKLTGQSNDSFFPGLDTLEDFNSELEEEKEEVKEEIVDEEEDNTSEVEVKKEEKKVSFETNESSENYKTLLKGMWGDTIGTIVQEVDGEEVEVSIDDMDIDEEMFQTIIQSKIEQEKEIAGKNKISTEGISDFAKSLIEIDRNGGDISELLEMKRAYSDPLDNLDISTLEGQKSAIYLRKKAADPNQDDEEILLLIDAYEKRGVLEEKAEVAERELREAFEMQIEARKRAAIEHQEARKKMLDDYRKDLKGQVSNQFTLNDNVIKKLVNIATRSNEDGVFELDSRYSEYRRDPEKAARLALFLLDEDEYIKQVSSKEVKTEKLKSAKLKLRAKTSSGAEIGANKKGSPDDLISMDLFNR